ncbi:diguanylate cyclase (GGDEF) domain-containing protein [Persephonella hydrogeniphila]|uniref:diguanylate cyclase n=1 Tax=Persephonella hydrogeniphila TaxID=198703 RepID=A0A285MZ18_9AQUI|nr:sensor domain-containing diguanylate cyclase [Persephonella hydrogeniphila]SNZ02460.1 diguanylate cyclase (GGDEF) domain-containing protein [Persephonella hydrogeniphila]
MQNKDEILLSILKRVHQNFFKEIVSNPYFHKYLRDIDLNRLEIRQRKKIVYLYNLYRAGNKEKLNEELKKLGKLHEKIGIDFALFVETINRFELIFMKEIFKAKNVEIDKLFFENILFFDVVRNYTAAGYLQEYIKREKYFLRNFIEANLQQKFLDIKKMLYRHIQWKENILDYLINENNLTVDLAPVNCELGIWLENVRNDNPKIVEGLIKLHDELHNIAVSIVSLKKEEKYLLLVNEYNNFMKTGLLFLSGILAFIISEEVSKLQRDPLTGLLTRRVLEEIYLKIAELSILTGEPFGVAFIDIDNFKRINDMYGHPVGDKVLKKLSKIIQKSLRKSDYIFRYGGEEFLVIIPATTEKSFEKTLEKIRTNVQKEKIKINGDEISFTVSIGGVLIKSSILKPLSEVIKEADRLMYKAKKSGKNRVIIGELS